MREIIWEVTANEFERMQEYATLHADAAISSAEYLERLRSMGMPACGAGTHVRIVLRTANPVSLGVHAAALRAGVLPGLPN